MKAIIEFSLSKEILEKCTLKEEEKELLINHIIETMEGWINGEVVVKIEFIESYEEDYKCNHIHNN